MSDWAIELKSISKRFGKVQANDSLDLQVRRGSIHGIVGENGAGKSTLMKVLYGLYRPDSGDVVIHGTKRKWSSPVDSIRAGIGMVHQHFMLAGPYTALDNVILGQEPLLDNGLFRWLPAFLRPLDREGVKVELDRLGREHGLEIPLDQRVEELSVGVQQRLEILKLLYRRAEILILDEPTAVLTPQETKDLFEQLRQLRDDGKTILIITHKLKEVMELTDEVTVIRQGQNAGRVKTSESGSQELADMMVGRSVSLQVAHPAAPLLGDPIFSTSDLTVQTPSRLALDSLNMNVRAGEVVGIAGVEGNGQSALLSSILHPSAVPTSGQMELFGKSMRHWSTKEVKAQSIGMIPEDRHEQGLLLKSNLVDNFLLGQQDHENFVSRGWIRYRAARERLTNLLHEFDVRPPLPDVTAGALSGGNQQKLIIAREMYRKPKFLVAAQPTRGVDVGAIEQIHSLILDARNKGAGVLLVSSELDEVMALSDRILVFCSGRIVAEFERGEVTERTIGLCMGGATRNEAMAIGAEGAL